MKTISALLLFLAVVSFRPQTQSTAIPERQQGIDIYVMSEPTRPYEIIKTGTSVAWLGCGEKVNTPVNQAAKTEGAQAIIIYFPASSKYSIIKYKD